MLYRWKIISGWSTGDFLYRLSSGARWCSVLFVENDDLMLLQEGAVVDPELASKFEHVVNEIRDEFATRGWT